MENLMDSPQELRKQQAEDGEDRVASSVPHPQDVLSGSTAQFAPLRYALRAMVTEQGFREAPFARIGRLKPVVAYERFRLMRIGLSGVDEDAAFEGWTKLVDGAVIGLVFAARVALESTARSSLAPLAVAAVGALARRQAAAGLPFMLYTLQSDDFSERIRAGRITRFVERGLIELGFSVRFLVGAPEQFAERCWRVSGRAKPQARFLCGRHDLYAQLEAILSRLDRQDAQS